MAKSLSSNPSLGSFSPPSRTIIPNSFSVVDTAKATGGFTVYKVTFEVKVQKPYDDPVYYSYETWKRFSDFQHLSKQLESIHASTKSQDKFPILVKAKYFERFKDAVIEERKSSAHSLLEFVSSHNHLADSELLKQFTAGSKMVSSTPFPQTPTKPSTTYIDKPTDTIPLSRQLMDSPDLSGIAHSNEEKLAVGSSLPKTNFQTTFSDRDTDVSREESVSPIPPHSMPSKSDDTKTHGSGIDGSDIRAVTHDSSTIDSEATTPRASLLELQDEDGLSKGQSGSNVSLENLELLANTTLYEAGDDGLEPKGEDIESAKDGETFGERETDFSSESSDNEARPKDSTISLGGEDRNQSTTVQEVKDGNTGMSWWAEAMAESENVTDNLDALVEKLGGEDITDSNDNKKGKEDITDIKREGGEKDKLGDGETSESVSRLSVSENKEESKTNEGGNDPQRLRSSSRSPSPGKRRGSPGGTKRADYIAQAGRLITQALNYEKNKEYQEAFDLLKAGVDLLLNGVQTDRSKHRREIVSRKTSEYLQHAEFLFQKHLASNREPSPSQKDLQEQAALESLPAPPTAKPHLLPDFKVVNIMGKVMLVESRHTGQKFVFKVLYKSLQAMAAAGKGAVRSTTNRAPFICNNSVYIVAGLLMAGYLKTPCPHMVKLLHHYETSNHRIFLLLEYARRGKLIDFVRAKKDQWQKLHEAALNPPASSSLLKRGLGDGAPSEENTLPAIEDALSTDIQDKFDDIDDQEMERMLSELTSIDPPRSLPVTDSLTSNKSATETESEATDSLDSLAIMRKRLEDTMISPTEDSEINLERAPQPMSEESVTKPEDFQVTAQSDNNVSVNVQPPTPTVSTQTTCRLELKEDAVRDETVATESPTENLLSSNVKHSESVSVPQKGRGDGSGTSTPRFSPGSLRNSPEPAFKINDWVQRMEENIREWAAQITLALEHLHHQGIICRDLNPENILLSETGRALLTYFGKWDYVKQKTKHELVSQLYMAPELLGLGEPTMASDWWSLGALLFEILTGKSLLSCHPDGIHSHLPLRIPVLLSPEAQSLLRQLLQVNPNERLGSGLAGAEELKSHPFFIGVDWRTV